MEKKLLLEIKNLNISFKTYAGEVKAVRGVSFSANRGEVLAIVGESGSGKSVTVQSIMRLLPSPPAIIKGGEIFFNGEDILKIGEKEIRSIRGGKIGMIFQDPMSSLNPTMTVGSQIAEGIITHLKLKKQDALEKAVEMMELVQIPDAKRRAKEYPHQFSGGMRQRVMIAMALACKPELLIADEPTTALDVTIQSQIIELLKEIKNKINTSIIFITHDLGVVADIADRAIVMYGGKIMEEGEIKEIYYNPEHPYTWGLMNSIPGIGAKKNEKLKSIDGTPPDMVKPPLGCPFAPRCEYGMKICQEREPERFEVGKNHFSYCWIHHADAPKVDKPIFLGGGKNK